MRKTALGFLAVILLSNCQKDKAVEAVAYSKTDQVDHKTSSPPSLLKLKGKEKEYAILPFGEKPIKILEGTTPTVLTAEEIDEVYRVVQGAVDEYNIVKKHASSKSSAIDLNRYRLQLIPVVTAKGEKEVWVNAFCSNLGINWKNRLLWVNDGGECYFQVSINLLYKKWHRFSVNGEA